MDDTTAALSTELLRTSNDPLFRRLRELLPGHVNNVESDIPAERFPDDVDQELGVVVTEDQRVFTFVLHYGRKGDLNMRAATAVLADWTDMSTRWEASPCASNIRGAFEMIRSGTVAA